MRLTILLLVIWTSHIVSAFETFYFVTHNFYMKYSLDALVISSSRVKGNNAIVTQQCRRTCAKDQSCKAYQVSLLQGTNQLGAFNCSFYGFNACDYRNTALKTASGVCTMWDKLDATLLKPKPCINHCAVKYKGDCSRCGALSNFTGLDCDIAPKLCSDYTATPGALTLFPIWPWGFGGRNLTVLCKDRETVIIRNTFSNGIRTVNSLGWPDLIVATSLSMYMTTIQSVNRSLISELQSLSTEKKLFVHVTLDSGLTQDHAFSGLEIGTAGELSLNASLTGSTGFPTPLSQAPFVNSPVGYGFDCGPFWRFTAVVICDQRTKLLNYGYLVWDGQASVDLGSFILSFK